MYAAPGASPRPMPPAPAPGHPAPGPDTVLVTESSWAYLASGYRPGEELLAAQTRHEINQTRADKERAKSEGEVWQ